MVVDVMIGGIWLLVGCVVLLGGYRQYRRRAVLREAVPVADAAPGDTVTVRGDAVAEEPVPLYLGDGDAAIAGLRVEERGASGRGWVRIEGWTRGGELHVEDVTGRLTLRTDGLSVDDIAGDDLVTRTVVTSEEELPGDARDALASYQEAGERRRYTEWWVPPDATVTVAGAVTDRTAGGTPVVDPASGVTVVGTRPPAALAARYPRWKVAALLGGGAGIVCLAAWTTVF